jgi:outer membrane receptor protein involved in Fe transport
LHWSLRAEGGDYGDKLATGFINVPLQDNLTVRIAGQYQHRDGYIDNVLGGPALDGNDGGAVRASLDWRPTPSYRSDLIFNYESDHTTGTSYKSETFDPTNPVTGAVLGNTSPWTALAAAEPAGFEGGGGLGERRIVASETWLNDYAFSKTLKLTSTTAVRHFQSEETYDIDGFSLPLVGSAENVRDTQYSQEFRLTNDGGGLFGWTLGASGFGDDGRQTIPLQLNEPELLSLLTGYLNRTDPAPAPASAYANPQTDAALLQALAGAYGDNLTAPQALAIANNLQPDHQEQYANSDTVLAYDLFGDLVVRPTSKIEVEGGVRFSEEHKTTGYSSELDNGRSVLGTFLGALSQPEPIRSELLSLLSVPGSAQIPSSATFPLPLIGLEVQPTARNGGVSVADLNDSGLSWKLAARYALTPDINLYANYARGRRPEVLSAAGPSAPYGQPIFTKAAAETLDSVETGLKTRLLNGALRFDAAIYGYKYNHFQTLLQQGVELLTVDAGGATTYGAEAQATWIVAPPLQLFASYAFTHARFDTGLYAGNHFRLTPDHALSGGAVLSADLGGGGQLRFTPTFSWQSKVFFNDDNANPALLSGAFIPPLVYNEYQNSYGLLNLRLSYTPARAPWQLEAFVTNALDTHYLRDAGDSGQDFGLPTYVAADPRFFGLSFTIHD